jgi:hypothetical protein
MMPLIVSYHHNEPVSAYFKHISHWINQFDTIVLRWIVTGCDHDPNNGVFLLGTASSSQANTEDDMVQTRISIRRMLLVTF